MAQQHETFSRSGRVSLFHSTGCYQVKDMKELSDIELLEAYAGERNEDAFRELVARHINLIYSAAIRQLRNSQLAEEATPSAFIALAGKAGRLPRNTVVAGGCTVPSILPR